MTQAEGPEAAPWLTEYLHELAVFPNGKHDDQANSTAQFLDWFKTPFIGQNMYELLRREAEAAEQRRKPQPTKTVYAPGSEPEDSLPVSRAFGCGLQTPRWRKADSNHRSRSEKSGFRNASMRELHRAAYRGGRKRYRRGRPSGSRRPNHSNTATASELQVRPVGCTAVTSISCARRGYTRRS